MNALNLELSTLCAVVAKAMVPIPSEEVLENESELSFVALYDFMKDSTALEMLDETKGELIFPLTPLWSDYSTTFL